MLKDPRHTPRPNLHPTHPPPLCRTTYSRLAATCSYPPCPERALALYHEMRRRSVHIDSFATLHLATALAAGG